MSRMDPLCFWLPKWLTPTAPAEDIPPSPIEEEAPIDDKRWLPNWLFPKTASETPETRPQAGTEPSPAEDDEQAAAPPIEEPESPPTKVQPASEIVSFSDKDFYANQLETEIPFKITFLNYEHPMSEEKPPKSYSFVDVTIAYDGKPIPALTCRFGSLKQALGFLAYLRAVKTHQVVVKYNQTIYKDGTKQMLCSISEEKRLKHAAGQY